MSGELQVVFVYDTLRCRREEDDPKEAILYFHPEEISESRRIAICGQLMGITHFLSDMFSSPKILSLENGKFALKSFGRQYILALGCSSVTPDWLLEKQADILYHLTRFFHKDIDSVLQSVNGNRTRLSEQLTCMMDHYIPISQQHGDLFALTFGILPILNLPKSANNVSLSATIALQTCLQKQGVLGGLIMFQNKVISVELVQDVAQKLAFIQPYQLPPAAIVSTKYRLPPGVQLLKVYIPSSQIMQLQQHALTFQRPSKEGNNVNVNCVSESKPKVTSEKERLSELSSGVDMEQSSLSSSCSTADALDASLTSSNGRLSTKLKVNAPNVPNTSPCVQNECCKASFRHSSRLFKSLENLVQNEKPESTRVMRNSLHDPYFPFLRFDGKTVSKCYMDGLICADHRVEEQSCQIECPPLKSPIEEKFTSSDEVEVSSISSAPKSDKSEPIKMVTIEQRSSNEEPIVANKKPVSSFADSNLNRPKELSLNLNSNTRSKTRRRWSTFEDMMSPVMENPHPVIEMDILPSKNKSSSSTIGKNNSNFDDAASSATVRNTLLNSFRKLTSPSSDETNIASEKTRSAFHCDNKTKVLAKSGVERLEDIECNYEDVLLFIYSLGGMRLLLLLQMDCVLNQSLIQSLRELASVSMAELELSLSNIEEQSMSMGSGHHDHYCYLHYEPVWRSLAHGGRNHNMDFDVVQQMHQDFQTHPNLNELIIRGEDHVVYGYQCIGSEVFYQQSAGPQPGLPIPSDVMGKVPFKAKRRLERDHNILLL